MAKHLREFTTQEDPGERWQVGSLESDVQEEMMTGLGDIKWSLLRGPEMPKVYATGHFSTLEKREGHT